MSKLDEVSVAYLQAPITFPGVFSTLTTISGTTAPAVRMTWSDKGLLLTHGKVTAIVPTTNVKICVFKNYVEDNNQGK